MLKHPETGWIERTGYPSWLQEQEDFRDDDYKELCEGYVGEEDQR